MNEIKRRLEFDAGHRVMNHEGKCRRLHGHRYVVELYATADRLDPLGRVIDFSVLKSVVGTWIDENLDHKMILFVDDEDLIFTLIAAGHEDDLFLFPLNPTAENIAVFMYDTSNELLKDYGIEITRILVHETPNCSAEYRP